nr:MAG TPA: hypothetical protein [Caudoviricetes sp.]
MKEIQNEKEFLALLPQVAQSNFELGELTKSVKSGKELLKSYMLLEDIESVEVGDWGVTCSSSTKSSMDEDMLVKIVQDLIEQSDGLDKEIYQNLIVMKPSINADLLEDLIYNEQLDQEVIKPAITETVSYTLRFKKIKKKSAKSRKNS